MVGVFCLTELARYLLIPAHLRGSVVLPWRSAPIQSLRCKKELSYFSGDSQKCYFLGLAHNPTKISFIMEAAALSIVASSPFTSSCATRAFASVTNNDMKEDHRSENATLEPDVEASRLEPMVYKRRSTRRRVLKETSTAKGNALNDLTLKDSVSMNPGTPSEVQAMGNISQVSNEPKHRKRTNRTGSPSIETPKCTASKAVHGSRKRKLSTKSSAKGTLCTEEILTESALSTDDCSCKIKEESKVEFQNVIDIDTTSERYNADTVIKKMDPWLILVHKKLQPEWSVYNPLTMRRPEVNDKSLKLISWNVNGLRALLKGGDNSYGTIISKLAEQENFDVLCLQETKLQEKNVPAFKDAILPAYENSLWSCSTSKLGYSGTAVISKIKPLSVTYGLGIAKHDNEGRLITLEFDSFFLATCYVPNSGQKLERLAYRVGDWDVSLSEFLKDLEKKKPVILTGDLNCAHQEIDIYNPDGNRRSAGFTDEERASFEKNFLKNGFDDTFRKLHPNSMAYTYWGYRTAARPKNHGWRLDYFLASKTLSDVIYDSFTLPDVEGSDHCPIGLTLKF